MARSDVSQLYQELLSSEFDFVPPGEFVIQTIYSFVQKRFLSLCDDEFLCLNNCRRGNNSPEWQHVVRKALQELKQRQSMKVVRSSRRGYWIFGDTPFSPIANDFIEPPPQRVVTTSYRVVRDTVLSRKIKALHRNKCQICGLSIPLPHGQLYSEAHHIKPLGEPHNGPDIEENILILCPNHHAMCDYGSIELDIRTLRKHPVHVIGKEFIKYHNTVIIKTLTVTGEK